MKTFKGYIFSRRLSDGSYVPQKLQNLTIRNTCENRFNVKFLLSSTEYIFDNSYSMLHEIINSYLKDIDGIAFYSLFQLPLQKNIREKILKNILNKKKHLIMSNEKIYIKSYHELSIIDDYINISTTLKKCPSKIILSNNFK